MGKSEGEPQRSDGQPCPALQKIQETEAKNADNGEAVPVVFVTPETLAAIGQTLAECEPHGPILPDGPLLTEEHHDKSAGGKWHSARKKVFGLLLLAAGTSLVSGLCYGLHCQTHANHKDSEARNFRCHTKVGRRRSVPDGPVGEKSEKLKLLAEDHQIGGEERPECVARAECCVNRQPDGRCRTTAQPCRLFVGTDDIRAMLAEIRAGVVGLAMGPPSASEKNPAPPKTFNSIGNFDYLTGFEDVWFNRQHYDLRGRDKARICLEYLVQKKAFLVRSARHFLNEIDPHVREQGDFIRLSEIKIKDYFREPSGQLAKLRQALIRSAGKNGKYYLNIGAG